MEFLLKMLVLQRKGEQTLLIFLRTIEFCVKRSQEELPALINKVTNLSWLLFYEFKGTYAGKLNFY